MFEAVARGAQVMGLGRVQSQMGVRAPALMADDSLVGFLEDPELPEPIDISEVQGLRSLC